MKKLEQISHETSGSLFLLGNEAIARGALEAGVGLAATYPGTPSSEVGETLADISPGAGMYFEYSINEKVAVELAYGAAISGVRSLVFMKHVGLNVASDVLNSISYTGVNAGMVIMTADDPSMYSSQNEQDNRRYAELTHLPMIEPSSPQEAKDYLIEAFAISEKYGVPVLFRTSTRVSHLRGVVNLGKIPAGVAKGKFTRDLSKFIALPSNSYRLKVELIERDKKLEAESEATFLNRKEGNQTSKVGIIASGAAYNVTADAISSMGIEADILKIGFTNPLPKKLISDFLISHSKVAVSEELDPYMEMQVRAIAQMDQINSRIYGKLDGIFPESHEYTIDTVTRSLKKALRLEDEAEFPGLDSSLPPRPPVLCPGCPHRAMYYAVKRAVKMSGKKDIVYSSDIGCYSLGFFEPFEEADLMLEMGASIGAGQGIFLATGQPVISFIGDSTFFHSGITSLANAVRNGTRMLLIVLDNRTTAMTGQEPNPGVPENAQGEPVREISIESVVKSLGVSKVGVVDPYDLQNSIRLVSEYLREDGVSVIIARRECAILRDRQMKKKREVRVYTVDQEKCGLCYNCVENFACPAISIENGMISINPSLCDGCGVCAEPYVCPFKAIKEVD